MDESVEEGGGDGKDVFECEAGRGKLGLEAVHGEGGGGVFGLGGEHEGDEGLEAFVLFGVLGDGDASRVGWGKTDARGTSIFCE